jgi:hypothetical protein
VRLTLTLRLFLLVFTSHFLSLLNALSPLLSFSLQQCGQFRSVRRISGKGTGKQPLREYSRIGTSGVDGRNGGAPISVQNSYTNWYLFKLSYLIN